MVHVYVCICMVCNPWWALIKITGHIYIRHSHRMPQWHCTSLILWVLFELIIHILMNSLWCTVYVVLSITATNYSAQCQRAHGPMIMQTHICRSVANTPFHTWVIQIMQVGSPQTTPMAPPSTYLVWSIVTAILCLPFGLVAVMYSRKVSACSAIHMHVHTLLVPPCGVQMWFTQKLMVLHGRSVYVHRRIN